MSSLPDKPSELIRVALWDLMQCEQDERYRIEMGIWHYAINDRDCAVCLAGAVIAKTFGVLPTQVRDPSDFPPDVKRKLYALDCLRTSTWWFLDTLGVAFPRLSAYEFRPCDYKPDPAAFKRELADIADQLQEHGL
jgi:hypothetical protein